MPYDAISADKGATQKSVQAPTTSHPSLGAPSASSRIQKPLLSAIPKLKMTEADPSSTVIQCGDWMPFLKTVARAIRPRWQEIAEILHLTAADIEEFNTTQSPAWWPAYKMLEAWRASLPKCQPEQLRDILADAVGPFDRDLADSIRYSQC